MEKRTIGLALLFVIIISGFVVAQGNDSDDSGIVADNSDKVSKAYSCLESEIDNKDSFALEEAVFGTLALGSEDKLNDVIENEKKSGEECWPKSGCTIKDTAQVLLAYDRIGKNNKGIQDWLLSKNGTATDLTWFLEIEVENHVESSCTVKYDDVERTFNVRKDFTLQGSGGTCLSVSSSGYWLKIKEGCLGKKFKITCDEDFLTTLIYQKGSSGTVFVSSTTHSAPSLGTTTEEVRALCFKNERGSCDYEGSLWSALALHKTKREVSSFIPYLLALAQDNGKYFPSSFLYILGLEDQVGEISGNQKQGKYWQTSSNNNRFYDTSLAMLALSGSGAAELGNAQSYLLNIQTEKGCWNNNNIRDTGFILYSGWPKSFSSTGGISGVGGRSCIAANYFCEREFECLDSSGLVYGEFDCPNFKEICCSLNVVELTCGERGGVICGAGNECSTTNVVLTPGGSCCLDSCRAIESRNTCTSFGGTCKASCSSGEELTQEICPNSLDICCKEKIKKSKGLSGWFWVILLIFLIALVSLGIIYRNKLRVFYYKWRGKVRTSRVMRPPGGEGGGDSRSVRPAPMFGGYRAGPGRPPRSRSKSPADKEMEETLRKLREIGK